MDTAQWPQEILVKPMEEIIPNTCSSSITAAPNIISNTHNSNNDEKNNNNHNNNHNNSSSLSSKPTSTSLERKVRPQKDHALNCPRCSSTNTKFCYYNNYSLTQPRYFCKTCRRYWTQGGSLRSIPVGGGSRKNKRSSSSSSSSLSSPSSTSLAIKKLSSHDLSATTLQQHHHHHHHHHLAQNPKIHHYQGHDLNLGFNPTIHQQEFRSLSEFMQLPTIDTSTTQKGQIPNSGASTTTSGANHHHLSALELLNGLTSTRGLNPFMPMPVPEHGNGVYSSGFPPLQDYKPSLNFSLVDGLGNGFGGLQGEVHHQASAETNNGRLLFPFEDLKQVSSTTSADHNNSADNNNNNSNNNTNNNTNNHEQNGEQGDSTPGYWSGMLGSGGSW